MGKVIDQPPDEVDLVWNLVGLPLDEVCLVAKLVDLLPNLVDLVQDEVRGVGKLLDRIQKLVDRVRKEVDLVPHEDGAASDRFLAVAASEAIRPSARVPLCSVHPLVSGRKFELTTIIRWTTLPETPLVPKTPMMSGKPLVGGSRA